MTVCRSLLAIFRAQPAVRGEDQKNGLAASKEKVHCERRGSEESTLLVSFWGFSIFSRDYCTVMLM